MDIFVLDNVKAEKLKALLSYNCLQTLSKLFRFLEICLALVLISWISARLPFLFRISGDYLRRFIVILLSPLFIFILINLIVVTFLAKSGRLTSSEPPAPQTDLYENLIGEDKIDLTSPEEEIACEDKEIISESKVKSEIVVNPEDAEICGNIEGKVLRRNKSESVKEAEKPKLRRSEPGS